MTEKEHRDAIVAEAKTWLRTPWHHEARVKGHGVDCGMLILEVYHSVGLLPKIEVEHYPPDFMLHRGEEWYLRTVLQHGFEIPGPPLPGDVILFKQGRSFSHGGIVISWPMIIHATAEEKCVSWGDVGRPPLSMRPRRFFRFNKFKK